MKQFTLAALLLALAQAGCVDSTATALIEERDDDLPENVKEEGSPFSQFHGIAVVGSDYDSTTISVLDPSKGTIASDNFLNTGSVVSGLSDALSADVVVASSPTPASDIVVIDRETSVVTWVDGLTLAVKRQVSVGDPGVNPHDVLQLSATKAYVSRYGVYGVATTDANDVAIVDPSTGTISGSIPMAGQTSSVDSGVAIAQPGALADVGGHVYLVLESVINTAPYTYIGGNSAVVVIDPATDGIVTRVEFAGVKGCGGLTYSSEVSQVVVACSGMYDANQVAESALVVLDASVPAAPAVVKTVAASTLGSVPLLPAAGFIGGSRIVAATYGVSDWSTGAPVTLEPDIAWMIDLTAETAPSKIVESEPYALNVFADPGHGRFYVSDAKFNAPSIHVYAADVSTGTFAKESTLVFGASTLPPRLMAGY